MCYQQPLSTPRAAALHRTCCDCRCITGKRTNLWGWGCSFVSTSPSVHTHLVLLYVLTLQQVLMTLVRGINGINSLAQGLSMWVRQCQMECGANFLSTTSVHGIMSASARQTVNSDLKVSAPWQICCPLWMGCFYSPLLCSL